MSFNWFRYVSQGTSTDKPERHDLFIETPSYIYMVSDTDPSKIVKSADGLTWADVEDRDSNIKSAWYDRSNEMIYFLETDKNVFRIDLSDDSVDEYGTCSDIVASAYCDIFIIGSDIFVVGVTLDAGGCGALDFSVDIEIFKWVDPAWVSQDTYRIVTCQLAGGGAAPTGTRVIVIGTVAWMILEIFSITPAQQYLGVFKYDNGTTTLSREHNDASYYLDATSYQFLVYDGSDLLYFKAYDGADWLLMSYSIGSDTLTEIRAFTGMFQLERNCANTSGSPYEFEKGWEGSIIYQLCRGYNHLFKLQDLALSGETIIAISDIYIMTSTPTLYKYTSFTDKLIASGHEENIFSVPTGSITHSSELSTDQLIEIYFYSTIRADYTLVFRGKAGIGELANKRWTYNLVNLGAKDFAQSVSYTASATGIDEVVIALVGQLTNPYIWCDTNSVPNIATNMTYVFDNSTLWDALYVCAVLANAYFGVEANGCLYFRTYASMEQTGWYLGSGGLNYETVGTSGTSIAWVDSATLYDGACEIVESIGDHYNVIRLTDDATAGEDPQIRHTLTQATSGIFEFWVATNDVTEEWHIYTFEDTTVLGDVYISASKLQYIDTGGAHDLCAMVNDTWYHVKIQWYADNTIDYYVNGTLYADGVDLRNNQVSGTNQIRIQAFGDSTDYLYLDSPGLVGEVDPRNVTYVAGYNDEDTLNQATNNISYPTSERMESKFNIWDIDGGWNEAANAPFNKRETDEEHILQYGPNQWTGRDTFSGARTQAALDAIAAGLKAWQGMMDAPYNASFRLIGRWYYPIGKYMNFQFTPETTFATAADMLISRCSYDHKNPKMVWMTLTQNIVRMG